MYKIKTSSVSDTPSANNDDDDEDDWDRDGDDEELALFDLNGLNDDDNDENDMMDEENIARSSEEDMMKSKDC